MSGNNRVIVVIGNWDVRKSSPANGLGICHYGAEDGNLDLIGAVFPNISVGAACFDPRRNVLYCTDECTTLPGYFLGGGGQVFAFLVDPADGKLTEINRQPSYGTMPSYLTVDATGQFLLVTHHTDRVPITKVRQAADGKYSIALEYDDAATVLFPLRADGAIGEPCDMHKHTGNGGPLAKQTHPQLHSVTMSPSGSLFAVCDKGNDEIVLFRIDYQARKLAVSGAATKSPPGSSPRYSAFHPTRPFLLVNHESSLVVCAYRYDEDGRLDRICTVAALPEELANAPGCQQSDIRIHPSGKYTYTLIRGSNAISVFAIAAASGELERIQTVVLDGTGPRGCAISPDGRFMLVAALTSHEVLIWRIDDSGRLHPTGRKIRQPNPGSVTFC